MMPTIDAYNVLLNTPSTLFPSMDAVLVFTAIQLALVTAALYVKKKR